MKHNPVFVIVCGGSGSGKTTIAELIKKALPSTYTCEIISLDNFYYPSERKIISNFDEPDALDWFNVAGTVKSLIEFRVPVQVPKYDFVTHSYSSYTHIKPSDVIILEGIFSLYNENVRNLASIKIFVDVPDDERLIRRILRDVKERNTDIVQTVKMWRDTVIDAHHKYVEPSKYNSDIIVPWGGNSINMTAITAIAGAIEYEAYTARKQKVVSAVKNSKEIFDKEAGIKVKSEIKKAAPKRKN